MLQEAARNNYISLHPEAAKEPGPSEHEARLKMSMVANDVAQEANRRSQLTSSTDEPVVDSLIKTKLPISTENVVTPDSEKIKVRNSSENAVITATYRSEKVTNKSDEMSQEGPYSQAISKLKSPPSVRRSATFTTSERPISKVGVTRTNSKAESPNVPYEPRGTSRLFKAKSSEGGTATQAVPPRRLGSKNQDKHSSKSRHSTTSTGTRQSGESTADKNTEKKTKNKVPPLVIPDNDDENEEVFSPISAKTQFQIMEALDMLNKAVAEEDPNSGGRRAVLILEQAGPMTPQGPRSTSGSNRHTSVFSCSDDYVEAYLDPYNQDYATVQYGFRDPPSYLSSPPPSRPPPRLPDNPKPPPRLYDNTMPPHRLHDNPRPPPRLPDNPRPPHRLHDNPNPPHLGCQGDEAAASNPPDFPIENVSFTLPEDQPDSPSLHCYPSRATFFTFGGKRADKPI